MYLLIFQQHREFCYRDGRSVATESREQPRRRRTGWDAAPGICAARELGICSKPQPLTGPHRLHHPQALLQVLIFALLCLVPCVIVKYLYLAISHYRFYCYTSCVSSVSLSLSFASVDTCVLAASSSLDREVRPVQYGANTAHATSLTQSVRSGADGDAMSSSEPPARES
jgi:hypothetical protein